MVPDLMTFGTEARLSDLQTARPKSIPSQCALSDSRFDNSVQDRPVFPHFMPKGILDKTNTSKTEVVQLSTPHSLLNMKVHTLLDQPLPTARSCFPFM